VTVPVVLLIIVRHGLEYGFSFEHINYVVGPFFRNHVAYAALLVVSFPFFFFLVKNQNRINKPYIWIILSMLIILVGVYFSYTRAAYGALLLAFPFYFVIRYRLTKAVLIISLILGGSLLGWLINENRYLNLAPQYERAITHSSFDDLLDATYKFEDISTMERLYRWVAAFRMIEDKPIFGFGPNNFYGNYKNYTLSKFKTYVSDNPERSGMHNYLLMTTIEQGIPGLIIFLALLFTAFLYAEKIYHKHRLQPEKAWLCLAATFSLLIIVVLQLMNDLIETDKVGPFFFLSLAIFVKLHLEYLDSKAASDHPSKA
jgi:O-antigen ligase